MLRPIVLSNGELHVGLNNYGLVHDLYYPYVGLSNHAQGMHTRHRIGVWIDGRLSWLDNDGEWTFSFRYPTNALIGHTIAKNESMQILLEMDDFVDSHVSAFMRNIHVVNLADHPREIRLFMHQAFAIDDSRSNTDTAQYLPDSDALLHYRGRRAFIISGMTNGVSFDQHSVGLFGIEGHDGTYRDAEDGELSNGNVEHGRVDSIMRFRLHVDGHASQRVHYWITAGSSLREALYIDKQVRNDGLLKRLHVTADWWRKWLEPAARAAEKIDPKYHDSFMRSVMVIKSQIDKRGAVIASTDTSMLNYGRDTYAYCWPRDGALVLWPLMRMGYTEEPYRFFEFCKRVMHPSGYLMHKFRADGGMGSSWHSYVHDGGMVAPPIQEDETAVVVFAIAQLYQKNKDARILHDFYDSMVKPMANWMTEFIDETTGLPKPSYDLWEEVFLISTYTVSLVYAALQAAADLADVKGDSASAVAWRAASDDIQISARKYLYNADRKAFYKGVRVVDGQVLYDSTIDMSGFFAAFTFGLFNSNSEEVKAAAETIDRELRSDPGLDAYPRYEYDQYNRIDPNSKGNWWFITTFWMAQYFIETGQDERVTRILDWVNTIMMKTGVMSEQISPIDHSLVAPAPLNWSHAEYVSTLLDTIKKDKESGR
ncbi:glycoside hydrolase family 15 protein [Candidatus Saccharibacteria bacterium]|nr:glycoside hydrolase family 15 protein [Candidatus Saccharibacteria bacterium]